VLVLAHETAKSIFRHLTMALTREHRRVDNVVDVKAKESQGRSHVEETVHAKNRWLDHPETAHLRNQLRYGDLQVHCLSTSYPMLLYDDTMENMHKSLPLNRQNSFLFSQVFIVGYNPVGQSQGRLNGSDLPTFALPATWPYSMLAVHPRNLYQ
jgi:hypothetical protein